jgi:dTDP-4-dehydro-6-deoxy-alpha-D-gulose 4-ketoreductase
MKKSLWKNKKVVVTGAGGFLGSHFCEYLAEEGAEVIGLYSSSLSDRHKGKSTPNISFIQGNVLHYDAFLPITQHADLIINCAALDGNAVFKATHSALILDVNMRITSNILNAARENRVPQVVLMSSAEVYPLNAQSPIVEEDDYKRSFDYLQNGYVLSKRFSEIIGERFQAEYGTRVFLPRLTNVYGPCDNFKQDSMRVIPSLINSILHDQTVEIWGDGTQVRSFIYVDDAVRAVLSGLVGTTTPFLNIGTTESITIGDLAVLIAKLSKKSVDIRFDITKQGGVQHRTLDVTKLQSVIDFPMTSLRDGLTKTIEWCYGAMQ